MNLAIARATLLEAVQLAAVATGIARPIFACVALEADGDHLSLRSCSLVAWTANRLAAEVDEVGACAVQADLLADILAASAAEQVRLRLDGDELVVTLDEGTFRLATLAGELPPPPESPDTLAAMDAAALAESLRATLFAAGTDRFDVLQVEMEKRCVRFCATDGRRLSVCEADAEVERARTLLLSGPAARALAKASLSAAVTIAAGPSSAEFRAAGVAVGCLLAEGEFPDWKSIVPGEQTCAFTASDLAPAIKRAALVRREENAPLAMEIAKGSLRLRCRQPEVGDADVAVAAEVKGKGMRIGVNPRLVLQSLAALKGEATFSLLSGSRPIVIRGGRQTHVIMPMQLEG